MIFFPVRQVIANNRSWMIIALIIFSGAAIAFYLTGLSGNPAQGSQPEGNLDQVMEFLYRLIESNPLVSALLVFMNNFLSMAQMLILGCLAGISPLFTLGLNGALVGYLLAVTAG